MDIVQFSDTINRQLDSLKQEIDNAFENMKNKIYRSKINKKSIKDISNAINTISEIEEVLGKINSFDYDIKVLEEINEFISY